LGKRTVEFLFETNRATRYAPRRIQQISKETAEQAQITRQIYPHLLQHSMGIML
jgi:site-specific recombinase XerD